MEKYIKVKKIGEGSFGKAILVKDKGDGEHYVVKEIGISRMKPKERNEARKEVTVLAKMRHPNIVQYKESFEENGFLYIVMEYCEGGDLYALINKQKGALFSERQILDWFVQLCLALKHVHDRKILHRDIKSSNIFLTKSGTIKLGDFGIARVLNNTMELARTCIGTPYYLSPEICENKPYNNKSDVWALGCVVYETLTLKHAFEAGNMKNLVLKIIRGSYPPVPSHYSYDLRILVSRLFRRNPRERPSINSILRMPFLATLTEQFLSPEQHDDEFSHTVLHKGRAKPSSAKPSYGGKYQPPAGRRMQNLEVRGGAVAARNRRDQQIAAAYGPSVVAKKPKPRVNRAVNEPKAADDFLDKKRQQLIEEEKRRKERLLEEKKRRLEDLQRRQRERAQKVKEEQMKRARDEARVMNLKRSAELLDPRNDDIVQKKVVAKRAVPAERPVSAPKEVGNYEKYHEYLSRMERGDRNGAADFAVPGLNRVKEAWDDRQKKQAAIVAAHVNRAAGEQAANRAQVVSEYLQRKHEAMLNKQKGNVELNNNRLGNAPNVGVAGALKPYSAASKDNAAEQQYLSKLQQIRQQNYHERRALQKKFLDNKNVYKVQPSSSDVTEDEEARKKKIAALQQQAADRSKILQANMERRRDILDAQFDMKKHDAKARARGILPPDERPVKYNPNPIGVTQALHAVGAPIAQQEAKEDVGAEKLADEVLSPSRMGDPSLRRKILQRVNQRFSVDFEENKKEDEEEEKAETKAVSDNHSPRPLPRPLPVPPSRDESKKEFGWKAWNKGTNIVEKLSNFPLQDTTSPMQATSAVSSEPSKPPVAKRQWDIPSGTFVRKLNQMTLQAPTMTLPPENEDTKASPKKEQTRDDLDEAKSDEETTTCKPAVDSTSSKDETGVNASLSIQGKTMSLRKNPTLDAADAEQEKPVIHIAANFKPNCGTYVIKPIKGSQAEPCDGSSDDVVIDEKPAEAPRSEASTIATSPRGDANEFKPKQIDNVESKSEKSQVEIKTPKSVENTDVSDDVEVLMLPNESKRNDKAVPKQKAWSDEAKNVDELPKSKPPLLPKPVLLPKPALSPNLDVKKATNDAELNVQLVPEKESSDDSSSPVAMKSVPRPTVSESPFFQKVNKLKPNDISTSPLPKLSKISDEAKPSPLSKTLYCTASDEMLLKLTLGHFDSPNPKLLRTCSLPDLNSVMDKEETDQDDEAIAQSFQVDDQIPEVSVAASMNDTNFDEDEEEFDNTADDDVTAASDDEEFDDLRANLQSVLLNADDEESSSPPYSAKCSVSTAVAADDSDEESESEKINEDWQSDVGSSASNSSDDEEVSDTESVFCRLEHNREELERELGFEKFLKAYKCVQALHEDEDESVAEGQSRIKSVLGEKHNQLYPRILQLVMADGAYCEDND